MHWNKTHTNPKLKNMTLIKLASAVGIMAAVVACGGPESNGNLNVESETSSEAVTYEVYGDSTLTPEGAVDASELLAMLEGVDSIETKVTGEVLGVCKKKGCWMDVDLGNGKNMTVRFKDYGFFVPMNSEGRKATLNGVAKVDTQSVDWLRHKAHDAGKSQEEIDAITEPVVKITFLADGVIME